MFVKYDFVKRHL